MALPLVLGAALPVDFDVLVVVTMERSLPETVGKADLVVFADTFSRCICFSGALDVFETASGVVVLAAFFFCNMEVRNELPSTLRSAVRWSFLILRSSRVKELSDLCASESESSEEDCCKGVFRETGGGRPLVGLLNCGLEAGALSSSTNKPSPPCAVIKCSSSLLSLPKSTT